ncbi:MAG: NAD-glutamate dehydrogenase [Actinomycetales bacterium]|nr:NAD-glutamate dehydrogenase [Actinomycetales bacterium]
MRGAGCGGGTGGGTSRTEVIAIQRPSVVKNAIIVPVGSKGAFVPVPCPTRRRS